MEMMNEAIFENLIAGQIKAPTMLDPFNDLRSNPAIRIDYKPRKMNSPVPFMDFHKKDRRWLDALITDLADPLFLVFADDSKVMMGEATARRGRGTGSKTQSWSDFITELHQDKVQGQKDYSEAQLKHLPVLIGLLSANGKRLQGCGWLELRNIDNGALLS